MKFDQQFVSNKTWVGPIMLNSSANIYAHLLGGDQGRVQGIFISRNPASDGPSNDQVFYIDRGKTLRIVAGDNSGVVYLWAHFVRGKETYRVNGGNNYTIIYEASDQITKPGEFLKETLKLVLTTDSTLSNDTITELLNREFAMEEV